MMGGLQVTAVDADHGVGNWKDVFLLIWRNRTTMEAVHALPRVIQDIASGNEGRISLLTVVEPTAEFPAPPVRNALAEVLRHAGSSVTCSAVAFEGQGFKAATVRAIVTGLTLIARQPFPHKIFPTVTEASGWLANRMSSAQRIVRPGIIILALEELRQQVRVAGGSQPG